MKKSIAVLAGDGIGPEIMESALWVLDVVNKKCGLEIVAHEGLVGGRAYDRFGDPLPRETLELCEKSDAILFGAVGGPVEETQHEKWRDIEKRVILGLRKKFDLFANLRPLTVYSETMSSSPLKETVLKGVDILVVRELVSGIYFGPRRTYHIGGEEVAEDTNYYAASEIERTLRVAFEAAKKRGRHVTVVDKANVLDTSRLWRSVADRVHWEYEDVDLDFMFVDNAAMQLVQHPSSFDVVAVENMFGDILSDLGGALVGARGLLPSASLNEQGFGMYEPVHGSAHDIAGKGSANPTAQILSLAMMLRYSFGLVAEGQRVEQAVVNTWQQGFTTEDLARGGKAVFTKEFTRKVCSNI